MLYKFLLSLLITMSSITFTQTVDENQIKTVEDKIVNSSVREVNDELLEKQIYAKIDFDSYFDNIDNIKKNE